MFLLPTNRDRLDHSLSPPDQGGRAPQALGGVSLVALPADLTRDIPRRLAPVSPFCKREYAARGFSLIELLLALAIFSLLLGGVFASLNEGQHSSQISREETEMHQNLQDVLSLMTAELRTAGFPPETYYDVQYLLNPSTRKNLVAQGLVLAGPQEIRFQGDIDGDKTVDYVRYYLSGSSPPYSLNRAGGAIKPDGSLPGGSPQKVSEQVESFQLRYFNSSSLQTSTLADVVSIEIQLTLRTRQVDPLSRVYRTVSESTRIRPLNL
jgi:prepilin-type N-terminal cleavage/methylation domain-containing protein